MLTIIRNFVFGIVMAIGELVPGIGMQTVAIVLGVYDDIIKFLFEGTEFLKTLGLFFIGKADKTNVTTSFKRISWSFGIPTVASALITMMLLAGVASHTFEVYPMEVSAAAFGIVLASVFIPYREMKDKNWSHFIIILLTFLALFGVFSAGTITGGNNVEPNVLVYFGAGLLASLAGFFPGISISFAMLLVGLYEPLLGHIAEFTSGSLDIYSFSAVSLFIIGLFIGLLLCVRLLALLIERFKSYFLALIVGLILASLRATWPFMNGEVAVAPWTLPINEFTKQLVIITIAVVTVSIIRKMAEGKGTISSSFGDAKRKVVTK